MMKKNKLNLRKLWLSLLLLVGATAIASADNVAIIGNTEYETLQEAVNAVPTNGTQTTITMIANEAIDVVGSAITIPSTKNIVLDLAGHTVSGQCTIGKSSALIQNLGTLKVQDSSGEGKLTMSAEPVWVYSEADPGGYASDLIRNEKNLTVESGLLYNYGTGYACYAIDNFSAGNVTINGGKVDAAKASAIRLYYNNGGSLTVTDGIIGHYHYTNYDDCTYYGIQVMSGENVNATVNGGTIAGQYAFYANNTGGNIAISGGTFDGYVGFAASVPNIEIKGGAFNDWVGTFGEGGQTKFISGGIYTYKVAEKYIADGYILADNTDPKTMEAYPYAVRQPHYICAIGDTKFETLADAVAAAGTAKTTITLLTEAATDDVISGDGVVVPENSNITFDLNGLTYDVTGEVVGSSGTENQGFQLLQGSNITFKNGTITSTSAYMLIKNYCDLTLTDVTLEGSNLLGSAPYTLSNNCGNVNINGETNITAKTDGFAFDTCKFGSYTIPTVNVNTTGTITGKIEATGGKLIIESGKFDVTWVTDANYAAGDIQISGGIFTKKPAEEYCAEGCIPSANTDKATKAVYPYTVKKGKFICAIGETKYETLADAVAAAGTAETTITLLTEAATEGVISGDGVVVPENSNITFDLNGLTYDVTGEVVGSSGTESQGFQLLKNSNITFKNGTLKASAAKAQMVIQNYSNLTLENVTVDGTALSGWAYALSNNSGTVNLTGSTSITAKEGGRAFETCKFGSYTIPTVTVNTTGEISGPIEATGGKLNIENGKFDVTWVTDANYAAGDIQIKGGVYTAEPAEEYCAEGYIPTENTDEETSGTYPYAVKTKEDVFNGIATDISSVLDQESEIEGIYTTNGVKVEHVVKGVNVIRYKDGRIKKVSIK